MPRGFAVERGAFARSSRRPACEGTDRGGAVAASSETSSGRRRLEGDRRGDALRAAARGRAGRARRRATRSSNARSGEERPPVAVRSSALGEDSAGGEPRRPAGELPLGARHRAGLRRGARLLGEPLHPARDQLPGALAAAEREPAMGVTVQLMVDAEVSGVMFTCNPVSGDPSMVALNASWGLGHRGRQRRGDARRLSGQQGHGRSRAADGEREARRVRAGRRGSRGGAGRGGGRSGETSPASARRSSPRSSRSRGASSATSAATRTSSGRSRADGRCPTRCVVLQARPVTTLREPAPKLSASALSLVMGTFGASREAGERS